MQNASRGEKGERDEDRDVGRKEGERGKEERNGSIQPVEEQMTNRQLKKWEIHTTPNTAIKITDSSYSDNKSQLSAYK